MKKYIVVFLIFLVIPKIIFAHQCGDSDTVVSGVILDYIGKIPLSDVQVQLQINSVERGEVFLTDNDGEFEVFTEFSEPKGSGCNIKIKKIILTISRTDYETVTIERKIKKNEYQKINYNLNFRFLNYLFDMGKIELKKIK